MIDWLHKQGVTRDSVGWGWAKVVSLAGLIVSGVVDLSAFGLSPARQKLVMGLCGAVLYLSAQASTSPLRGKP